MFPMTCVRAGSRVECPFHSVRGKFVLGISYSSRAARELHGSLKVELPRCEGIQWR